MKKFLFSANNLLQFMTEYFVFFGVPAEDARVAAEILLAADLRGVDSHGIIRLYSYYGCRLKAGMVNPLTPLSVTRQTLTTTAFDAGNGLGLVAGQRAMQHCIAKAQDCGAAVVTVRNSNHYGIAGYYAMMALEHDMIGLSFTNSQALVAPTYGSAAMLGTNPIAVAVPTGRNRPFVLDMATSIVPIGRITVYEKSGQPIPAGWGIDHDGRVVTDPHAVLDGGALMPLGGTDILRGYKGYGLALVVDILCGVLAGADFSNQVGKPDNMTRNANVGHCFAAIKIDAFRDIVEFKNDMDHLLNLLKNSPKAIDQDRIYIHGEKEFERAEKYQADGIPLLEPVVKMLKQEAAEVGLSTGLDPIGVIETD